MKYVPRGFAGLPTVELTRRNLRALLAKLDESDSTHTLIDPKQQVAVTAVEDDEHYADRPPGKLHPETEAALAE